MFIFIAIHIHRMNVSPHWRLYIYSQGPKVFPKKTNKQFNYLPASVDVKKSMQNYSAEPPISTLSSGSVLFSLINFQDILEIIAIRISFSTVKRFNVLAMTTNCPLTLFR